MTLDEYEAMQRKPKPVMAAVHPLGMKLTRDKQSIIACTDSCLILNNFLLCTVAVALPCIDNIESLMIACLVRS